MPDEKEEGRKRRRQRELELEKEHENTPPKHLEQKHQVEFSHTKIDELLKNAEPLLEQLNNLYNMYCSGNEPRPPLEKRQQLEQIMTMLKRIEKPTAFYQFRYNTIQASYQNYKTRWDRLIRELEESGHKTRR
ncbi:MAG: hypothetical protein AABZ06_07400 [Bdellovibrionota bacterium]